MSIHKTTVVVAAIFILGGTTAYLVTRNNTPEEIVSIPPSSSNSAAAETSQPSKQPDSAADKNSATTSKPYSPNEELAKLEAMSPHPGNDEFTRRLSVKHERLLKDLTTELGLNAAQSASLRDVLDTRLATFRAALDFNPLAGAATGGKMEMLTKAGGIIRGTGLREQLAGILSDEQLTAFDKREEKIQQTQVESHAYRELAKLTPVLGLSEEQKDRTFELLQTSSTQHLNESADARAFMALKAGQSPARMELNDLEEANFIHEAFDGAKPMKPDSPEFREKIIDVVGRRIHGKVELLAPILDDSQKQRYRDHLYHKSLLPAFGIKLPEPE